MLCANFGQGKLEQEFCLRMLKHLSTCKEKEIGKYPKLLLILGASSVTPLKK